MIDKRSKKIALVAHCIMNQNSRVPGLAKTPGSIAEILKFLLHMDIGIVQLQCPELSYMGVSRQRKTKNQLDSPAFRQHCQRIADETVDQIENYTKHGISLEIIIGVDGSPSCGVREPPIDDSHKGMSKSERSKRFGILMEELDCALKSKNISVPFHGIRYERLPKDLATIEEILKH